MRGSAQTGSTCCCRVKVRYRTDFTRRLRILRKADDIVGVSRSVIWRADYCSGCWASRFRSSYSWLCVHITNRLDAAMDTLSTAPVEPQTSAGVTRADDTSAVCWQAVIAGTVVAAATSLILLALGSGIGLASVSPWPGSGASATTVTVMMAIWLIVVQWVASGLGGYLTGRLRSKWVTTHTHEVFFRDTAHGLLMWALATVLGTVLLASTVLSAFATGTPAAGMAASGGINAVASAVTPYDVDTLFRSTRPDANGAGANASIEATRILGRALTANMPVADRSYLAELIVARSGISQAEAQQRVDAVTTRVREAANAARKASATASIYLALSMLIGAFIACVAAAMAGRVRDIHPRAGRLSRH